MTTLQEANVTLAQALHEMGVASPKPEAIYWLLGLVYGESKFGTSPDWTNPDPHGYNTTSSNPSLPQGPSHNWGAIRYHGTGNFILHGDRNADGTPGVFKFQAYPSAVAGAKGFLATLLRGKVPAVLQDPNTSPYDLARAMYENRYYTGVSATPEENIQAYGNMVKNLAEKVRRELGSSPAPFDPSRPVPLLTSSMTASIEPTLARAAKGSWAIGLFIGIGYLAWKGRR